MYICVCLCYHTQEGECFAAAANLDTHKALVHIFFAQRDTKKIKGVTDAGACCYVCVCVYVRYVLVVTCCAYVCAAYVFSYCLSASCTGMNALRDCAAS